MKLSEFKLKLAGLDQIRFRLPDGEMIPSHFHVTEIGLINKHFIDCGGTIRNETTISFQLWSTIDIDHRLAPKKLSKIIALSESKLELQDAEIEVEYQQDTIGTYQLDFDGQVFLLIPTNTGCLASDRCGIPEEAFTSAETAKTAKQACCEPGGKCC